MGNSVEPCHPARTVEETQTAKASSDRRHNGEAQVMVFVKWRTKAKGNGEAALYSFMHMIKYKERRVREDWSGGDSIGLK